MVNKKRDDSFLRRKISNRLSYTIISLVALILAAVVVYAVVPNPGHAVGAIEPPNPCPVGQFLQWTGSAWRCNTACTSDGQNCPSKDCVAMGGENVNVQISGTINFKQICRFNLTSCPFGWTQYESWSTAENRICCGMDYEECAPNSHPICCSSQGYTWSNSAPVVCLYYSEVFLNNNCFFNSMKCYATILQVGCY